MNKRIRYVLPLIATSLLASCGASEVSREDFNKKVEERQANAKPTDFTKVTFSGSIKITSSSSGQSGNIENKIDPVDLDVTWDSLSTPSFKASASANSSAENAAGSLSSFIVLSPSTLSLLNAGSGDSVSYYAGSEFKIEGTLNSASSGQGTMTYVWNSDLLLTSVKGSVETEGFSTDVDYIYSWKK